MKDSKVVTYKLIRLNHTEEETIGMITRAGKIVAFTLEDQPQTNKIKHETRIQAGSYQVKFRKVLSPLTKKYRARYEWFDWHLELQKVPNFQYIYFHVGNRDEHTSGCILVANTLHLERIAIDRDNELHEMNYFITRNSTEAFKKFYIEVSKFLNKEIEVRFDIIDLDLLYQDI